MMFARSTEAICLELKSYKVNIKQGCYKMFLLKAVFPTLKIDIQTQFMGILYNITLSSKIPLQLSVSFNFRKYAQTGTTMFIFTSIIVQGKQPLEYHERHFAQTNKIFNVNSLCVCTG